VKECFFHPELSLSLRPRIAGRGVAAPKVPDQALNRGFRGWHGYIQETVEACRLYPLHLRHQRLKRF
jgi:hypothetical protein